jgi:hypothetical protein
MNPAKIASPRKIQMRIDQADWFGFRLWQRLIFKQ